MKCSLTCERALEKTLPTSISLTIKAFFKDFTLIKSNIHLLQTFYAYLSSKYRIDCEVGMVFVERLVTLELEK